MEGIFGWCDRSCMFNAIQSVPEFAIHIVALKLQQWLITSEIGLVFIGSEKMHISSSSQDLNSVLASGNKYQGTWTNSY